MPLMETEVSHPSHLRRSKRSRENPHPVYFRSADEMAKRYLVRGDGRPFGIEILQRKFVGFLFAEEYRKVAHIVPELMEVHDQIRRAEGDVFEIVYVKLLPRKKMVSDGKMAYGTTELHNKRLLGVPLNDLEWREHLGNNYCYERLGILAGQLVLFDKEGRLLEEDALEKLIDAYGPAYYPFTAQRERQIINERREALSSNSLQAILGSSSRDYVISNDGHSKVPISQLEGKIVGVYLYDGERQPGTLALLLQIYRHLKSQRRNFELVFINVDHSGGYKNETTFFNDLKRMPWLALPFKDEKIRALVDLLAVDGETLAIVGSDVGDKFIFRYAFQVIIEYGIRAYPFTIDGVVKAEKLVLAQTKLRHVFRDMGVEYLVQKVGKKNNKRLMDCSLKSLRGQRVVLYFASRGDDKYPPHKGSRLVDLYEDDGSFKVVFISLDMDKEESAEHFDTMPMSWLAVPFSNVLYYDQWRQFVLEDRYLIAFKGHSGKLARTGTLESFGCHASHFPFISREDFDQTLKMLLPAAKGWELEELEAEYRLGLGG